ncbi:MAG: hypothetical protein ABI642_05365, partial [Polaromonas sp.]
FFCGLRGERLPGGGWLSFLAKKKVTKESCLGAGSDQSWTLCRAFASLGSGHLEVGAGSHAGGWLVLPFVRQQLHALLDLVGLRCVRRHCSIKKSSSQAQRLGFILVGRVSAA